MSQNFYGKYIQGMGIFRNYKNGKWYGVIMNIDYSKLDSKRRGEVEIIDLKLGKEKVQYYLKEKRILSCISYE